MSRRIFAIVAFGLALIWQPAYAKRHNKKQTSQQEKACQEVNVIMDLGGVLIVTDYASAFWATGPLKFIMYIARLNNPTEIRSLLFKYLNTLAPQHIDLSGPRDDHGCLLPKIMCDWLAGSKTTKEIRELVCASINSNTSFFNNNAQRQLIRAMACMMFTPETFIKTQHIHNEGVAFVKACKKKGYKLYVLSNWDAESFKLLKKNHADLFELFDGIVASGDIGLLKPDTRIYEYILEKYDLDPSSCVFIDDQHVNIYGREAASENAVSVGAEAAGIFGIVCPQSTSWWHQGPDFQAVQTMFDAWLKVRACAQAA